MMECLSLRASWKLPHTRSRCPVGQRRVPGAQSQPPEPLPKRLLPLMLTQCPGVGLRQCSVEPRSLQPTPQEIQPTSLSVGRGPGYMLGHSKARARTQTPRFPHCTAASPWTWGQAHLLLLAISSLCSSIVSIKSRNWGTEPGRAHQSPEPRACSCPTVGKKGGRHLLRQQDTKELSLIQGEGGCQDREAQRGSPPTQLKSIRKEAGPGPRYWLLESPGLGAEWKKATAWGLRELCPHSQGGARLCSQRHCPYLLDFFPEVPHLLAGVILGTSLTLRRQSAGPGCGPWLALLEAAQIRPPVLKHR